MSDTFSVGVLAPSHWSHMAFVMSRRLARILDQKEVREGDIPPGVYEDARTFFGLVDQRFNGRQPGTLAATNSAYLVAREIVRTRLVLDVLPADVPPLLSAYTKLVNELAKPRRFSGDQLQLLEQLRQFFEGLHEAGAADRYRSDSYLEEPSRFHTFL